jgi:hypothetical protein
MSLSRITDLRSTPAAARGEVVPLDRTRIRRTTRERLRALTRTTTRRDPLHAAMAVEREYAVTVKTTSMAAARDTVEAITRMVPAVVGSGYHRCRIEATAQGTTPMSIMVESAAGDQQTIDTVLRCLESIAAAPLRAKVIIHEADRTHVRTWAGAWVEPGPRGRRGGGRADSPFAPAAA